MVVTIALPVWLVLLVAGDFLITDEEQEMREKMLLSMHGVNFISIKRYLVKQGN